MNDTDRTNAKMIREEMDRRLNAAWENLLATEDGRFIMHDLMDKTGVFLSTFVTNSTSAYLEGRRSIGLELINMYLAPQGAALHGKLLIEAEQRDMEIRAAMMADERDADDT